MLLGEQARPETDISEPFIGVASQVLVSSTIEKVDRRAENPVVISYRSFFTSAVKINPTGHQTTTSVFELELKNPSFKKARDRLSFLDALSDQTEKLASFAIKDADAILTKFAMFGTACPMPKIGMDDGGSIAFTFLDRERKFFGSMSFSGDGTYSYYIEKDGVNVSDGNKSVGIPLEADLEHLLLR